MSVERLVSPMDIVTQGDIAQRAGVTRHVVRYWEENDQRFPPPLTVVGRGRIAIYDWREVTAYVRKIRRTIRG